MEKGVNCHGSRWAGKWCLDCPEFGRKCDEMEGETMNCEPYHDKFSINCESRHDALVRNGWSYCPYCLDKFKITYPCKDKDSCKNYDALGPEACVDCSGRQAAREGD